MAVNWPLGGDANYRGRHLWLRMFPGSLSAARRVWARAGSPVRHCRLPCRRDAKAGGRSAHRGAGDSAGCFHRVGAVRCHRYPSVAARGDRVADRGVVGRHGGAGRRRRPPARRSVDIRSAPDRAARRGKSDAHRSRRRTDSRRGAGDMDGWPIRPARPAATVARRNHHAAVGDPGWTGGSRCRAAAMEANSRQRFVSAQHRRAGGR